MTQQLTSLGSHLIDLNPDHLWFEFSPSEKETAWEQGKHQSNFLAQKVSFMNHLSSQKIGGWLQQEMTAQMPPVLTFPKEELPSIWEFVNGTSLTLGNHRMVMIPSEGSDLEALEVPQEWVDIPGWDADYYLAIQVESEQHWLRVWGYTTYQQLKARGRYNPVSKHYEIERQDLIEDVNYLLLAQAFGRAESHDAPSLAAVSSEQARSNLNQHRQQPGYSPRMLVPFPEWADFLTDTAWRKQVYQARLTGETAASSQETGAWLAKKFQQGWQSLESFFHARPQLASQVRNHDKFQSGAAKVIDLGVELKQSSVALLVAQVPAETDKIWIHVQVHPVGDMAYLPPNLQLALLDEKGELVQQPVAARHYDHLIQLKRFKVPTGTSFQIQLSLDQASVTETFIS